MTRRCARCNSPVVEIVFDSQGEPLVMRSCNTCGRSWHRDDRELPLVDATAALVGPSSR